MNRIAIFGRNLSDENKPYMRRLLSELSDRQAEVIVYQPFYERVADCLPEGCGLFADHASLKGRADLLFSIGEIGRAHV